MSEPLSVSSVQDTMSYQTSTINLDTNPSFELNGNGVAIFQYSGVNISAWGRTSVYQGWVGSWTYYFTCTSTAPAFQDLALLQKTISVTAGEKYSASVSFRTNNLNVGARLKVQWFAGSTFLSTSEVGSIAWASKTTEYRRAKLNGVVAPANATIAKLDFTTVSNISAQSHEVATDGWQFEPRDGVTTYCDGDQQDCVWTGTAHASTSTRVRIVFPQIHRGRAGLIELYPELWIADINNKRTEDISYAIVDGFVEMDYTRDIKFHANFDMVEADLVEPYKNYLAPFLKLIYSDGTTTRHQLGLYVTEPGKKTFTARTRRVRLEGFDPTYNLLQRSTRSTYKLNQGTNVASAIRSLLEGQGFFRHRIQNTGKTIGKGGKSWPPGTTYLKIINSLCATNGTYAIFCDRQGVFTSFEYISRKNRKPVKVYEGGDDGAVLEPFEVELVERPYNEVIVYREVNDGEQYIGVAQNNNPASSTNIFDPPTGIGRRSLFINDPNIESNAGALALAREKLEEYGSLEVSANFVTFPEPWHDVHELYEIRLRDVDGVRIPQAWGTFWPTGWKIGLSARDARMTHRLKRFVDLGNY